MGLGVINYTLISRVCRVLLNSRQRQMTVPELMMYPHSRFATSSFRHSRQLPTKPLRARLRPSITRVGPPLGRPLERDEHFNIYLLPIISAH